MVDERFVLMENKLDELQKEKFINVDKLDNISDDIEGSKKDEVKLSDNISTLEAVKSYVDRLCRFNNKGYFRESEMCLFFHSDEICEDFKETGLCWQEGCRQRHPKRCYYGERCLRGKLCVYLHLTCDLCEQISQNRYYCEFCRKSFCSKCTIKKAQVDNIYRNEENEPKYENIHKCKEGKSGPHEDCVMYAV